MQRFVAALRFLFEVWVLSFKILRSKQSLSTRFSILFNTRLSFFRALFIKPKFISWHGSNFYYDHPATPFLLMEYELSSIALKKLLPSTLESVLDIGANIGQFSVTLKHHFPTVEIYAFEPNPDAFSLLERNAKGDRFHVYPTAVGAGTIHIMYAVPGRSAVSSFYKENSESNFLGTTFTARQFEIKPISDVAAVLNKDSFDLIKIDVEGAEFEVLQQLQKIKTKYLLLECSGNRERDYSHSSLFSLIEKAFGPYDILWHSGFSQKQTSFELLLEIKSVSTHKQYE